MSAGTLTVHQQLTLLTDLDALALQDATATSTIYVDDPASPAVRIVFEHDPAAPGFAQSFRIEDAAGTTLYAEGSYAVSLVQFEAAVAAANIPAALAVLIDGLGTVALADGANADLFSLKGGHVVAGNDNNNFFEVFHEATTVNAGGGDDVIVLRTTRNDGHYNGGEGYDVLWLDTSAGPVEVLLVANVIYSSWSDPFYMQSFENIEFFRGSIGTERFSGIGDGKRFEGGAGNDSFDLWEPDNPRLVDVVTYAEDMGNRGIVVNLGFDWTDTSGMDDLLEAALTTILAGDYTPPSGSVRDTFGDSDYLIPGFIVEGSPFADFYYGSSENDVFRGGAGADHFFGGDGDDEFDGGADEDTAYLAAALDDYVVTYDAADDVFTIVAKDGSGTDKIKGVEKFSFAGDLKTADELKPTAADSPPVASDDDNGADTVIEAGIGGDDDVATGNVLANDVDADDDPITVIGIRAGSGATFEAVGTSIEIEGTYGKLTIAQDGTWSYVLDNDRSATNALAVGTTVHDTFTYQISAGGETDEAVLDIAISGRNDAPIATADSLSTAEDTPLVIDASVLTANDSDAEGDALTVIAVQAASNGTVGLAGGKVTFTPTAGFHGTAGFSYTVQDALGATATQHVSVAVSSVNDPPLANGDTGITTNEDQPVVISAATLLGNDSDPDGDTLTIASVSSGTGGTAVLNDDGTVTFTPTPDFNGQAQFSYRVKDGAGALSAPAVATVTVAPVNDAPRFTGVGPLAASSVLENTTFVATLLWADVDSSAVTFSLAGEDAAHFAIVGNTLRFATAPDFEAPADADGNNIYKVKVTVSDGALSDTRELAISVLNAFGNVIDGTNRADRIDESHAVGGKAATSEGDVIIGKGGKDTLAGAAGDDLLLGGKGDDRLDGGSGDDVLQGGAGRDRLDGGAGRDTADFSDAGKSVVVTLNGAHKARARIGDAADDTLKNIENVSGGKRADKITGDSASNVLAGNAGNDVLAGRLGADTLSGGAGRDQFVFDSRFKSSNVDTILDFTHNSDRIVLDARVFKGIGSSLSANEFRTGEGIVAGQDRNDRIVYDTSTGALYYDRDGNKPGGAVAVKFAVLSGTPALDAGDFLIV